MTTAAPFLPSDRRGRVSFGLLAAGLVLYLFLFRDTLIDDAFITLSYARSLVTSATWGFYPGHVSNTATSPLNVMLLALASLVTRNPVVSVFVLTWLEFLVMALCLRGIGAALALPWFAPLAFTAMAMNPLLMSTLGLESVLLTTWLVAALYCYVVKRLDACAVVCALLTLTRPDGALLFVAILPFLPGARARLRSALIFGACLAPWYLFSWVYLGSLLPDSLLIKVSQSWGIAFPSGLRLYLRRYPWETILSFLWLPLALLVSLRSVRALGSIVSIIAGYLALHYAAYTILHVPPYHWYYVPEAVNLVLLGTLALATLARSVAGRLSRHAWMSVLVLAMLVPLGGMLGLLVRGGMPLREAPIHTNWATYAEYREIGSWLREHYRGRTGYSEIEVGTVGYYCDCFLMDVLTHRRMTDALVHRHSGRSTPRSLAIRLSFFFYRPQAPFPPVSYGVLYTTHADGSPPSLQRWNVESRWRRDGVISVVTR